MHKSKIVISALFSLSIIFSASAELRKAYVALNGQGVKTFTISEEGEWSDAGWLCKKTIDGINAPMSIAVGKEVIYVADACGTDSTSVILFNAEGEKIGSLFENKPFRVDCITLSPDEKYLYLSSAFGPTANAIWRFSTRDGSGGKWITNGLNVPRGLSCDPSGNLYVANRKNNQWIVFNPGGELIQYKQFTQPSGIFCDPGKDRVYLFSFGGLFGTFTRSGEIIQDAFDSTIGNTFAMGMMDGTLYAGAFEKAIYSFDGVNHFTKVCQLADYVTSLDFSKQAEEEIGMKAYYSFDDQNNMALIKRNTEDEKYAILPRKNLQTGCTGTIGKGIWFNEESYGIIRDSYDLIPSTNDFSVSFWIQKGNSSQMHYFLSNDEQTSGRTSFCVNLGTETDPARMGKAALLISDEDQSVCLWSQTSILDEKWHHLVYTRAGNIFTLWVDGVKEGETEATTPISIAQSVLWRLGESATGSAIYGTGAMDDLRIYDRVISGTAISNLYQMVQDRESIPAATKPPLPQIELYPENGIGTRIAHASAIDFSFGAPSILICANGTYLVSHDHRQAAPYQSTERTTIYRSTNQGTTWQQLSTIPCSRMSLFTLDGTIYGLGQNLDYEPQFVLYKSIDFGETWEWVKNINHMAKTEMLPDPVACLNGRIWKAVRTIQNPKSIRFFSIAYQNGTFGEAAMGNEFAYDYRSFAFPDTQGGAQRCFHDASTIVSPDGELYAAVPVSADFRAMGPMQEYAAFFQAQNTWAIKCRYYTMLPGASKPFQIHYDAQSKRYWAITLDSGAPNTWGNFHPELIRHTLSLYSSPDLQEWDFQQILLQSPDPTKIAWNQTAFTFDGNDLVLIFGMSAPDGEVGPSTPGDSNYLMYKRISNFRTPPEEKSADEFILAVDYGLNHVKRFWTAADGTLHTGKNFAMGSYDGCELTHPISIAQKGTRVYVAEEIGFDHARPVGGRILEFSLSGKYIRTIFTADKNTLQFDEMVASKFGPWLYVTDAFRSNAVMRIDLTDCTLSTVVCDAQTKGTPGEITTARGLVELNDGSLLIMNRTNGKIQKYNPDGTFLETVHNCNKMGGILSLSSTGADVFYTEYGTISKLNLVTKESQYCATASAIVMGLLQDKSDLYFAPLHDGVLGKIDLTAVDPSVTRRQAASGMGSCMRLIQINERDLQGTLLIMK